jgi:hypothetical protein
MGIQTVTGIVLDAAGDPWADAIVEIQFDDGDGDFSGAGVVGVTDIDGIFSVELFNNAAEVKRCLIGLPDDNLFAFDLDPQDSTPDVGNLETSGGSGEPRLVATMPTSVASAITAAVGVKLDKDISALAAATPVAADIVFFRTAGGLLKKVTVGDLATAIDGILNP